MHISIGSRSPARPDDVVALLLACHQRIRAFVHLAGEIGRRDVLPGSPEVTAVIDACQRCERYFTEALPLHVEDEEQSLLPRLRGLRHEIDDALAAMHAQHREHEPLLHALLGALRAVRADPGERRHRTRLQDAAAQLAAAFDEHLAIEEHIIFPAVRSELPGEVQARMIDELRARRRQRQPR